MRRIREVLRLQAALGQNITAIAAGAGMSRSTVREYLQRAQAAGIDAAKAADLGDEALEAALFAPVKEGGRPVPDWAKLDEELRRHKHVTRQLLWQEYKADHPDGYAYSQFKLLLKQWQKNSGRGLSMRQVHRAGGQVGELAHGVGNLLIGELRGAEHGGSELRGQLVGASHHRGALPGAGQLHASGQVARVLAMSLTVEPFQALSEHGVPDSIRKLMNIVLFDPCSHCLPLFTS